MAYLLIVDDDGDFAGVAATVLRTCGHEVAIEPDVRSAVRSIERRRPDLAILDVMFPEDDSAGFELARIIRRLNETPPRIPVLLLTALSADFPLGFNRGDADDARELADAMLEKPVEFDVLKRKVDDLLQRRGEFQTHEA